MKVKSNENCTTIVLYLDLPPLPTMRPYPVPNLLPVPSSLFPLSVRVFPCPHFSPSVFSPKSSPSFLLDKHVFSPKSAPSFRHVSVICPAPARKFPHLPTPSPVSFTCPCLVLCPCFCRALSLCLTRRR